MNFQKVIECLENPEKLEEFIARLKNAGENSNPVLQVQNAMTELNMHKAPKGIFEKTMLQNMFHFCKPYECFQSFRLVCKSWKNAVETIRFEQKLPDDFLDDLDYGYDTNQMLSTEFLEKYLQAFKKLFMPMCLDNKNLIFPLILKNMKKLNEIEFENKNLHTDNKNKKFIFQMLHKFHNTLRVLHLPKFIITDFSFPNMTKLKLDGIGVLNLLNDFKTKFPQILEKMENLESVHLKLWENWEPIGEYINQKYSKNCIGGKISVDIEMEKMLDIVPILIIEKIKNIERYVHNKRYVDQIQYAHFHISDLENSMNNGWGRYREILDQCTNLKATELSWNYGSFIDLLPNLAEDYQQIWQERLTYFEARGIRLVNHEEIYGNENLQSKLAKEAGIKWRFYFS